MMIKVLVGTRINIDSICRGDENFYCCFSRIFLEYGDFLCIGIVRVRYQTITKTVLVM